MRLCALFLTIVGSGFFLGACGGGGGGDEPEAAAASAPEANRAPTISGTPLTSTKEGTDYSFAPTASDPDGDVLTFRISAKPSWATFDEATGELSGKPGKADVGKHPKIRISVTDGEATTSLDEFDVDVVPTASGTATLSWTPPTQNTDGSPLMNLAGYKIYWGTTQGNYPNSVTLTNPGLTTYMVDELTPATWFFATTALNTEGVESSLSNVASKTVL